MTDPLFDWQHEAIPADTARLQDQLIGALIGLARSTFGNEDLIPTSTGALLREGLLAATSLEKETLTDWIQRVDQEKYKIVPGCLYCAAPCGRTSNYDMQALWAADEEVRSLKLRILSGIRGLAAAPALPTGPDDSFFYRALDAIGEDWETDALLPIAMEIEKMQEQTSTCADRR